MKTRKAHEKHLLIASVPSCRLIKHGFTRIQGGSGRGAYQHPKFLRDDRTSCLSIQKIRKSHLGEGRPSKPSVELELGSMSHHFKRAVEDSRPLFRRGQRDRDKTSKDDGTDKSLPSGSDHSASSICSLLPASSSHTTSSDDGHKALSSRLDLQDFHHVTPQSITRNITPALSLDRSSHKIPFVSVEAPRRQSLASRLAEMGVSRHQHHQNSTDSFEIRMFAPSLEPKSLGRKIVHIPPTNPVQKPKPCAAPQNKGDTQLPSPSQSSMETLGTTEHDDFTPLDITAEVQCDTFWEL